MPYFAEARAEARGLSLVPIESMLPAETAVVGQVAGGNEATLYVRLGNVLVRVTVVVPDGPAESSPARLPTRSSPNEPNCCGEQR